MSTEAQTQSPNKVTFWIGWVLSILPCLLLLMSASMKLSQSEEVVTELGKRGYSPNTILPIGVAELASTILYLIPQTAVLGAILLVGYLGGATATHVIAGDGMFWSPVLMGVILWLGLYLREPRLRALTPWRR